VSRSLKAHVLLILTSLIWGVTFVVIKTALSDISPLFFNALRMSLAALTLGIVFRGEFRRYTAASVRVGVLVGVFLAVGNELQTSGLKLTMPSKAAFLTGLAVVLVPLFLKIFWGRRISIWSASGAIAAFVGLYLLAVPASSAGPDLMSINRGDLLNIGCAIVFAFHIILIGHASQTYRWQQITFVQTLTSAVLMAATAPLLETPHSVWSARVVWAILLTGLLSLAAAFSVQAWAQQFIPATHTALIFSLEPVFAWITSFIVLGERLGARSGLGALFILAGVVASEEKGSVESIGVAPDHAGVPQLLEAEGSLAVSAEPFGRDKQ
jgi:drug/metabolite transporter (DMT)-like permease